jgi:hypothetical protein
MARIDKTDSAIGVQRGKLAAAWLDADINTLVGVGINSAGLVVKGGGQTGIVGVVIPTNKWDLAVGTIVDILSLGEVVECVGLAAGTQYYANATTGVVSSTNTGTPLGYTIESDRLIVHCVGRQVALTST